MVALGYKAIITVLPFVFLTVSLGDIVHFKSMDAGLPHPLIEQLEAQVFAEPDEKTYNAHVQNNFSTPVFRSDQIGIFDEKDHLGVLIPEYQGFSPQDYR